MREILGKSKSIRELLKGLNIPLIIISGNISGNQNRFRNY